MRVGRSMWKVVVLAGCIVAGIANAKGAESVAGREALRTGTDAARGRVWELGMDQVRVYDRERKLLREVRLPNWSVARFVCWPGLVIDKSGAAIVSSNVDARVWRIEPEGFRVTEIEIRLDGRERWDIGFGALALGADGRLFAVTTLAGTLWSVDLGSRRASLLDAGPAYYNRCELTPQLIGRVERKRKP